MGGDTNGDKKPTVVCASKTNKVKSTIAVLLWLSAIHLMVILCILVLFVLPRQWSLRVLAVLLVLMILPLYERSFIAQRVAKFICRHGPGYFPITLVLEDKEALNPKQAYVFAVEPHSVIPIGIMALCDHTGFLRIEKIKALASSAVFFTPILRHIWSWLGLVPASRKVLSSLLRDGYSCAVIPGGVREMLFMEHDREVVYLKQRLGFIRVAIETGCPLVPCFIFGQTRVYKWWKPKGSIYNQISRVLRFAPLVFWGMYGTPLPFPRPMHVVVGKPIHVKKNPSPTQEEVSEVQASFISCLQELYEKHKAEAGYDGVPLYVY